MEYKGATNMKELNFILNNVIYKSIAIIKFIYLHLFILFTFFS